MRPQKVNDTEIIASLVKAFRSNGYEGSSLTELAKSTGLKKASLYHRFPKGKEEMANAVLLYIENWVDIHIFRVLLDESLAPKERLKQALIQIKNSYNNGKDCCIFKSLSIGQGLELFDLQIKNGMHKWINAFKDFGTSVGLPDINAAETAYNTLIQIQGSLIVTKGMNDLSVFDNTLKKIEANYLAKMKFA